MGKRFAMGAPVFSLEMKTNRRNFALRYHLDIDLASVHESSASPSQLATTEQSRSAILPERRMMQAAGQLNDLTSGISYLKLTSKGVLKLQDKLQGFWFQIAVKYGRSYRKSDAIGLKNLIRNS